MIKELKKIEIAITNLGTGKFEYYDVKDKADYINSINAFNKEFNKCDNDIEIQLIDYDYDGKLMDRNLKNLLNLIEEYPNTKPQELVYLLSSYDVDDVRHILNVGIFYTIIEADNKVEAFTQYINNYDCLEIPENLKCYIDYEAMLFDWECEDFIVEKVSYKTYLVINC